MIRVGLVGCGRIADLHFEAYRNDSGAEVAAICDMDADVLAARKQEWGIARAYSEYQQLLDDGGIDAVEIITPQTIHEPLVIAAAAAGKHIAVQKPMTTSLESADRMLDAVASADIVYKVTDNYLTYPPLMLAKRLLVEGVIGEPQTIRMKFVGGAWQGGWDVPAETWGWRYKEVAAGRGIQTFDHGHHMWATAWRLMGDFERVSAWVDSVDGTIDCPSVLMWKHKTGKRYGICDYTQALDLAIPTDYYSCDEWFEVTGNAGIILVRRCTGKILDGPAVSVFTSAGWEHHDVESDWASGFEGAARNFVRAIRGEEAPLLSGSQAREVLRFALALRRSSDERRSIDMEEMG